MRKSGTCRLFDALVNLKKVKLCIKTFGKLKGQIYRNLSSEKWRQLFIPGKQGVTWNKNFNHNSLHGHREIMFTKS